MPVDPRKRFEFGESVGSDELGEVFRGRDESRDVAIKIFEDWTLRSESGRDAYSAALEALTQDPPSRTPGVVDFHIDEGGGWLSTSWVAGQTLAAAAEEAGTLTQDEAAAVGCGILDALAEFHALEQCHGGLTPGKVLLLDHFDPKGVVITDPFQHYLYSVKDPIRTSRTEPNRFLGSPQYFAPEQARGHEPTVRTDIYAIGLILYELVTGKNPFQSSAVGTTLKRQIYEKPLPPRLAKPGIELSPDFEAILNLALNKGEDERFEQPAAMRAALQSVRTSGDFADERTAKPLGDQRRIYRPSDAYGVVSANVAAVGEEEVIGTFNTGDLDTRRLDGSDGAAAVEDDFSAEIAAVVLSEEIVFNEDENEDEDVASAPAREETANFAAAVVDDGEGALAFEAAEEEVASEGVLGDESVEDAVAVAAAAVEGTPDYATSTYDDGYADADAFGGELRSKSRFRMVGLVVLLLLIAVAAFLYLSSSKSSEDEETPVPEAAAGAGDEEPGTDEAGSDEAGSDEAGTDEAAGTAAGDNGTVAAADGASGDSEAGANAEGADDEGADREQTGDSEAADGQDDVVADEGEGGTAGADSAQQADDTEGDVAQADGTRDDGDWRRRREAEQAEEERILAAAQDEAYRMQQQRQREAAAAAAAARNAERRSAAATESDAGGTANGDSETAPEDNAEAAEAGENDEDEEAAARDRARELTQQGTSALRSGNHSAARSLFEQALELDRNVAAANAGLGDVYFQSRNYSQAARYHLRATRLSRRAEYFTKLGMDYYRIGNHRAALDAFERAVALGDSGASRYVDITREAMGETPDPAP